MSRRYALVVSLITAMGCSHQPCSSRRRRVCDGYAKEASQKVNLNNKLKCGFQAPRGGSDTN
jgi:hypothetical protein